MRIPASILIFLMLWLTPAAAEMPKPAELPPADFAGAQYIDSKGCVFMREGRDWVARQGLDGAQICGFPPSRSAWQQEEVGAAPGLDVIERELTLTVVASEGESVEFRPDAAVPATTRPTVAAPADMPDVAPGQLAGGTGIGAEIARGIAAQPALAAGRQAAIGQERRLCGLLGLDGSGSGRRGDDPTGGYCGGGAPARLSMREQPAPDPQPAGDAGEMTEGAETRTAGPTDPAKHAAVAPAASPNPADRDVAKEPAASAQKAAGAETSPAAEAGTARPAAAKIVTTPERRAAIQADDAGEDGVPANARFIQIGRFDLEGATIAIRALAELGYPVVRERVVGVDGKRFVMAGPFATRERLIAALDRLRKAGYKSAVPR